MEQQVLRDLILYVVSKMQNLGGYTNATGLHKYVYLIDLEHYRRHGTTFTQMEWWFHHYGPWSPTLDTISKSMPWLLDIDVVKTSSGRTAKSYSVTDRYEFPRVLGHGNRAIVDGILGIWAGVKPDDVVDYVYNCTEPVREGVKYEYLNWEAVSEGTRFYRLNLRIDQEKAAGMRARLRAMAREDEEDMVTIETLEDTTLHDGLQAIGAMPAADIGLLAGNQIQGGLDDLASMLPPSDD